MKGIGSWKGGLQGEGVTGAQPGVGGGQWVRLRTLNSINFNASPTQQLHRETRFINLLGALTNQPDNFDASLSTRNQNCS